MLQTAIGMRARLGANPRSQAVSVPSRMRRRHACSHPGTRSGTSMDHELQDRSQTEGAAAGDEASRPGPEWLRGLHFPSEGTAEPPDPAVWRAAHLDAGVEHGPWL